MTAREPLDLDAIEALAVATPAGPWTADGWEVYGPSPDRLWIAESHDPGSADHGAAVAKLLAAARTAVPALVAEVRALRAALDRQIAETQEVATELAEARTANEKLLDHLAALADVDTTKGWTEVAALLDQWAARGYAGTLAEALTAPVLPERTAVPGEPVNLATWCRQRAAAYREYEHVEMAAPPTRDDRDTALVEWTVRTLGNPALAESRRVLNILADRHLDSPEPVARISAPGEPLPPIPDSAYPPSAVSLVLGVPDTEAAVDADTAPAWRIVLVDNGGYNAEPLLVLPHRYTVRAAAHADRDALRLHHPSTRHAAWEVWSGERLAHELEQAGRR